MGIFGELQDALQRVVGAVEASVVGVASRRGIGSGIVLAPGLVLTNAHNVWGGGVTLARADGTTSEASVAGADVDGDIAVLRAETGDAPPLAWAEDPAVGIGTVVFAAANPGGRGLRVSFGFVSGTDRSFRGPRGARIGGSIEHTAPLLPGSSGGPIVDESGRLLGVNTKRLGEGFYLAIRAEAALRHRADALTRGEAPRKRRLGIAIAPPHVARGLRRAVGLGELDGVLVRGVEQDGPAAAAGVLEGDMIVRAGGAAVPDADALADAVARADGSIELALVRGIDERTVTVRLS